MKINQSFLDQLLEAAADNQRLRTNFDLRTSEEDQSQRMLNALLPGTAVPIHRHPHSTENVICLYGRMDVLLYNRNGKEEARISLCPAQGCYGCVIAAGTWHSVEVFEPSVIYEGKDGKYGEDGSEILDLEALL